MEKITFTTDKKMINLTMVAAYLHSHSYWAKNRPIEVIQKSIENSLSIGVLKESEQIGFARVISDFATVYYLADFFIVDKFQNLGIGHLLMEYIESIETLKGLRGILTTQTAHAFYEKFGYNRDNDIVKRRIMVKSNLESAPDSIARNNNCS